MMRFPIGLEASTHTGLQDVLFSTYMKHDLPRQHINKLILS